MLPIPNPRSHRTCEISTGIIWVASHMWNMRRREWDIKVRRRGVQFTGVVASHMQNIHRGSGLSGGDMWIEWHTDTRLQWHNKLVNVTVTEWPIMGAISLSNPLNRSWLFKNWPNRRAVVYLSLTRSGPYSPQDNVRKECSTACFWVVFIHAQKVNISTCFIL